MRDAMRPSGRTRLQPYHGRFTVGHDATGHWIVTDARGLTGGIFADRAIAVHFAMAECDYNPGDVCAAPENAVLSVDALFAAPPRARAS